MLAGHYKGNRDPPAEIHLLSFVLCFLSPCQFLQGKKEFRGLVFVFFFWSESLQEA